MRVSFAVITGPHVPAPKVYLVLSLFYLFVLCFSVSFFSCLFPCNLMWGCSLWQIKGSHLWSVSFPQTKWEVRRDDLQHAYQRERESQGDRNVLTDLDREVHERKYNRNEQLKTRGGFGYSYDRFTINIQTCTIVIMLQL